jgi:hypothetical protein
MKPVKRQPQIACLLIHIVRNWTNAAKPTKDCGMQKPKK